MGKGEMTIEILEDGTIKVQTNDMSGPAHKAADDFLSMIGRLAGGEVTEEKIGHAHQHQHSHSHEGEHHHH
jgi:hypothetical protein